MNLLILGTFIGLAYAWGGMRLLMLLDDIFDPSIVAIWMADREGRTWIALVLWPIAVAIELVLYASGRAMTRWLRKGVRS